MHSIVKSIRILRKHCLKDDLMNLSRRYLTSKSYILQKNFQGYPKKTDLTIVEKQIRPLKDGEFLSEAIYISVDPYMRAYTGRMEPGRTLIATQVGKIVESKNPKFPVDKFVVGEFGCKTHSIGTGKMLPNGMFEAWIVPDIGKLPLSLALGVLGLTGNTAYFGLLELCDPKPGHTVVITGAAGAVGSHVGQIAKIKGCKVIGMAGSDDKGKWLVNDLGFDHFINYKTDNLKNKLKEYAAHSVDSYFDNVGGEVSNIVMYYMKPFGRVAVCGAISGYNDTEPTKATLVQYPIILNQLRMEGFYVYRWTNRWYEGIEQNKKWIEEGKLKYRETVTDGFDNLFEAFVGMLKGDNYGKAVVKV